MAKIHYTPIHKEAVKSSTRLAIESGGIKRAVIKTHVGHGAITKLVHRLKFWMIVSLSINFLFLGIAAQDKLHIIEKVQYGLQSVIKGNAASKHRIKN